MLEGHAILLSKLKRIEINCVFRPMIHYLFFFYSCVCAMWQAAREEQLFFLSGLRLRGKVWPEVKSRAAILTLLSRK